MRDSIENPSPPEFTGRRLTGRHVLFACVAFFGVIFAVNGYFLVSALSTHTGVVAVEPYRKGLAYNDRIAASERQAALGWAERIEADRAGTVRVTMTAGDATPLTGLQVSGTIGRPSTTRGELQIAFREVAAGRYEAATQPLAAGAWIVSIEASSGRKAEPDYRARRRLWLQP